MASGPNLPPPPGSKKGGGSAGLPPPPKVGSGSTSRSSGSEERTVIAMLKKHGPNLLHYKNYIFAYAKTYHFSAVYLAACLLNEDASGNPKARSSAGALGLAQILDGTVGNYNNSPLVWQSASGVQRAYPGQPITAAMKESPTFAIAYMTWRLAGNMKKGMGWPRAYTVGYAGSASAANPDRFIPGNYTPTSGNSTGGIDTTQLGGIVRSVNAPPTNPFVSYDKKTGKVSYVYQLGPNVMEYEGVPVTRSLLQRETQDKAGIGGDYYNFTGRTPNMNIVAGIMATGRNLQQVENAWIADTKHFKNSPAGKKYFAGYQDAWSQVMGRNVPVPWDLVQEAAKSNLNETEFAAKLRMDGFQGQQQNKQWSYLNSNEFQSKVDAYTTSYEKIYGETLQDKNMRNLAKDAALAGWDPMQWETYLRSLPQYTSTAEYQGHAMALLGKLGMDFGFLPGLNAKGYVPPNPEAQNQIPAPPGDKRVGQGKTPPPGPNPDSAGVVISHA